MSLDVQILTALRAAGDGAVSGAELSQKLRVSRAAIWARIEDLRSLGYDIEASPHRGYRLVSAPDVLHADDLISRLGKTKVIGRDIRVFQETTSTNDVIEKLARDGVKEGVVVFAESQTRGRGRLGRKWMSPAKRGLWFSVLLRPDLRPQEATRLTVASATALRRAIASQTGLKPEIKWPNDILIQGKKVAGILTELSAELDHVKYVILGIGVDVNLSPGDFPAELRKVATSLKDRAGQAGFATRTRRGHSARVGPRLRADCLRPVRGGGGRVGGAWHHDWPGGDYPHGRPPRSAAAPNRWARMASCWCAPSMATWSASLGEM